ncbi:MAG: RNA-binding protein [Candidatus Shapirobacteria bacterium]|jgi:RNA recognition motif-containing protein
MAKKLFVGNIPYTMTDDQLTGIFSQYGKVVSANIVKDKYSGRSKGYGFVEFENEEEAMKAVETLNGSDQGGRNIVVKEALPRTEQPVENQSQRADIA